MGISSYHYTYLPNYTATQQHIIMQSYGLQRYDSDSEFRHTATANFKNINYDADVNYTEYVNHAGYAQNQYHVHYADFKHYAYHADYTDYADCA